MRSLPLLSVLACTASEPEATPAVDHPFPEDFAWGSATAGFQVDMGCPTWSDADCLDTASDWYQWVTDPGIVGDAGLYVTGEDVRNGPGMWETFEDDIAAMAAAGHTSYRFSLEWSRLFPNDASAATSVEALDDHVDADAVARYHEMFAAMQAHGITPLVTVNHYVLPLWVHDGVACHADPDGCTANGWVDGDRMVPLIALFTGWVGREFGGEVDGWVTLNEPLATSLAGYLQPGEDRSAPPGLTLDGARTVAVTIHQVEGHAAMYDALHQWDAEDADGDGVVVDVGIVMNMVAITPRDPDRPEDLEAVAHADHIYHRLFLSALTSGDWDDDLDGTFDAVRPDLAGRLDWIGVNYYNELRVGFTGLQLLPEIPAFDFLPEFSWEPFPEGIASALEVAASYELPIVITENGSPQVDDADAILSGHLRATWDAMQDGADVRGYHYWSWVDNYEWNHGFDLRFGLNALEADKSRTPRPVMGRLTEIIEANGLD